MTAPTLSIVLNLHNEARYLRRTIASLRDAISFALVTRLNVELIVILDRPDKFTQSVLQDIDLSFVPYRIAVVDHGSLGLSRNAGVALAEGEYVAFADADDLVSFNFFSACYEIVKKTPDAGVFPEYLLAFGARCHLVQYRDADTFSNRAFFDVNPFTSRLFIRRTILLDTPYVRTKHNGIYAYEDWHLNATLAAKNISLMVAPDAWLFYRQRPESIMAAVGKSRRIPYSLYFSPTIYRSIANRPIKPARRPRMEKQVLLQSMVVTELLHAANAIDSAINVELLHSAAHWFPPVDSTPNGDAYLEVCEVLSHTNYDHVALVSFVSTTGAVSTRGKSDFLVKSLSKLQSDQDGNARLLVLGGEAYKDDALSQLTTKNCDFLDLYEIAKRRGADVLQLALRTIQSVVPGAQLHLMPCSFAMNYFSMYGKTDDDQVVFFYAPNSECVHLNGRAFIESEIDSFIADSGAELDQIMSDSLIELGRIKRMADLPRTTYHVIAEN